MAIWVIGYGCVQAAAPNITRAKQGLSSAVKAARLWGFILLSICALIPLALLLPNLPSGIVLLIGLSLFGFAFAINSSVHSYLILAYTNDDEVSLNVGFYYMANAVGRLVGTMCSGLCYMAGGIQACLWSAVIFCLISAIVSLRFQGESIK